ncbi:hypothetical protein L541_3169 [Bordetella hinzii CA90 BAL1384]|uniref:hypothetical protein n=1 Tax=Bordetella hinzii TaxID=103855 RepID=UPI00045B5934|nr:hypothetical protein [Bordetella hinzii]KCB31578.1 hypothetical protein L541_3169 [Bordetella hinzii CA90 BAL1384]
MNEQNSAVQPLLTGDEIRAAVRQAHSMTAPSDTTEPGDYVMAGVRALLSKLRAPVADERALPPLPAAWGSAINDAGDGHVDLYSAEQLQDYARAAMAATKGESNE